MLSVCVQQTDMTGQTATLIVGLAGIIATLIASGFGLYFIAKARSAPLREALFNKQIDLICKIVHKQSRFRVYATILTGDNFMHKQMAVEDIAKCYREFSELEEEAAAVLPTELWVEVKRLSGDMSNILEVYDENEALEKALLTSLIARMVKIALVSRVVLGVDELTGESLSLFSAAEDYERISNMEISAFGKMHEKANRNA